MMKKLLALLLSLVISTAFAQERKGNEVVYTSPQGDLRIQMCNEQMFRVTKSNTHQFVADEPWMVVKYDFAPVDFQVSGNTLCTSALQRK